MRLNSNQTRTRIISGNCTRCSTRYARSATRAITTNYPRTRLITITIPIHCKNTVFLNIAFKILLVSEIDLE